jgi:hypothetical protein
MSKCVRNGVSYKRHRWRGGICWFCGDSQSKVYFDSPSQIEPVAQPPLTPAYPSQNEAVSRAEFQLDHPQWETDVAANDDKLDNHNKDT